MWRKLLKRLTFLSFVLFLASIAWWVRTGSKVDQLTYRREAVESLQVAGFGGKVMLTHALHDPTQSRLGAAQVSWNSTPAASAPLAAESFSYASQPNVAGGKESTLVLPLWLLTAAFAVMPLCWAAPKFKKKPKKKDGQ